MAVTAISTGSGNRFELGYPESRRIHRPPSFGLAASAWRVAQNKSLAFHGGGAQIEGGTPGRGSRRHALANEVFYSDGQYQYGHAIIFTRFYLAYVQSPRKTPLWRKMTTTTGRPKLSTPGSGVEH